ncbi:hypothetical protein EG327_006915 [Venturia inaequalis]|uniref:Uncharacterized protein n=1 Tax=Venturia inaequalis TaxID=5025 RepID=A0A8H3V296_VENIN|nr:hypothetical protein EG327_006915 [Venturia inaequalis]
MKRKSGGVPRGEDGRFLKKAATTDDQIQNSLTSSGEENGQSDKPVNRNEKRKATFESNKDEIEYEPPEKKARVTAVQSEHTREHNSEEFSLVSAQKTDDNIPTDSTKPSKTTNFLNLPPELRLKIYRHRLIWMNLIRVSDLKPYVYSHQIAYLHDPLLSLLKEQADVLSPTNKHKIRPRVRSSSGSLVMMEKNDDIKSLLLLSKDISEEAIQVLYGENMFEWDFHRSLGFTGYLRNFLFDFPVENQQRIRRLRFVVNHRSVIHPLYSADKIFWSPILARLTTLELVLLGPLNGSEEEEEEEDEEEEYWSYNRPPRPWVGRTRFADYNGILKEEWFQWLTPWLQYIAKTVPPGLKVSVDDGGSIDTGHVVQECFAGRHRKFETFRGDFHYGRNFVRKVEQAKDEDMEDEDGEDEDGEVESMEDGEVESMEDGEVESIEDDEVDEDGEVESIDEDSEDDDSAGVFFNLDWNNEYDSHFIGSDHYLTNKKWAYLGNSAV